MDILKRKLTNAREIAPNIKIVEIHEIVRNTLNDVRKLFPKMKICARNIVDIDIVQDVYNDRITAIYSAHDPKKVRRVSTLLRGYEGKEHDLYLMICKKYHVDPEPLYSTGLSFMVIFL